METYYLIEWPESQKWMDCREAVQSEGMSYFVPCRLYDKNNINNER